MSPRLLARGWPGLPGVRYRPASSPTDRGLQAAALPPPRGVAGSRLRALPKIPHCCPHGGTDDPRWGPARVSVPVWLAVLPDQRPVIGLVGHYPTNNLIGRAPLRKGLPAFLPAPQRREHMRDYPSFWERYPALAGRSRTCYAAVCHSPGGQTPGGVRLACVRHAATVRPGPGSSPLLSLRWRGLR